MGYIHDHITMELLLLVATGLFAASLILLKFARSTKHGIAVATPLSILFMTGTSFFWSLDASGEYSRFRYGFPHYLAVKNYDFSYENPMSPLTVHFEYALGNLWFWFGACMFAVGIYKIYVKLRH